MPLQITIYNRQKLTSANGKEYIGRALAFAPGQRGAVSDTCGRYTHCSTAVRAAVLNDAGPEVRTTFTDPSSRITY